MINADIFIKSVPAALMGMLALWAAASGRHWFVRTAVVLATIAAPLLIPAHEIVVGAAVEVLVVVLAVRWANYRRRRETEIAATSNRRFVPRWSLQNLMLLVPVIAAVTAVAANLPHFADYTWAEMVGYGLIAGCAVVAGAWTVVGSAHALIRVVAVFLLWNLLTAAASALQTGVFAWQQWVLDPANFSLHWHWIREGIREQTFAWGVTLCIGMWLVGAWCNLLIRAGRYSRSTNELMPTDQADDLTRIMAKPAKSAQFCTVALTSLVILFTAALFYEFLTPTPLPNDVVPKPNGFDVLIQASRLIDAAAESTLINSGGLNSEQLQTALANVDDALSLPYSYPYKFVRPANDTSFNTLFRLHQLVWAEYESAGRPESTNTSYKLDVYLRYLRSTQVLCSGGMDGCPEPFWGGIAMASEGIWKIHSKLSAGETRDAIRALLAADANRDPWMIADRLRIRDENTGWRRHKSVIVSDWSRRSRYQWEIDWALVSRTTLRLLALELAIDLFQREHQRLPDELAQLGTRRYLPDLPEDLFSGMPYRYHAKSESHLLYSVGFDGDDDMAAAAHTCRSGEDGDVTLALLLSRK